MKKISLENSRDIDNVFYAVDTIRNILANAKIAKPIKNGFQTHHKKIVYDEERKVITVNGREILDDVIAWESKFFPESKSILYRFKTKGIEMRGYIFLKGVKPTIL